ncbi:MAG TPA: hypothetical protein VFS62_14205 [Chloroflexota bacterium]|nr:hypothetical protein [Chloroflexota bacterium]
MSLSEIESVLNGTAEPVQWTPRQMVWLMYIAQDRNRPELVQRLREVIQLLEARPAAEAEA